MTDTVATLPHWWNDCKIDDRADPIHTVFTCVLHDKFLDMHTPRYLTFSRSTPQIVNEGCGSVGSLHREIITYLHLDLFRVRKLPSDQSVTMSILLRRSTKSA